MTDRIWPNVMLQWEWLGGLPPLRRAAVIGAGARGAALAGLLARAGLEVDLGAGRREPAPPELPAGVRLLPAAELELSRHDLVCFADPPDALPAAVAEHAPDVPSRAGVLVSPPGVAPTLGAAAVAAQTDSWAVGVLGRPRARFVLAADEPAFRRQVADALRAAGARVVEARGRARAVDRAPGRRPVAARRSRRPEGVSLRDA